MFLEIFKFELAYRLKRPATYLYALILFLFTFLFVIYGNGPASEKTNINSPYAISQFVVVMTILGMLIASAVMGVPVYRDIEHNTKNYFFTFPITERGYILGRYLGSFVVLLGIMAVGMLGIVIGSLLGPVFNLADNTERFGPIRFRDYAYPFVLFVVPNMFLVGSIFFSLVAFSRQVFATYAGSILLFIAYLLGSTLSQDLENKQLVNLLDPFGSYAYDTATKYWSPVEQNTLLAPLEGDLLTNRLIWFGVAVLVFVLTLVRFSFSRFLAVKLGKRQKEDAVGQGVPSLASLPTPTPVFQASTYARQMFRQARIEFGNIVRDPYFIAILLGAVLFLFLDGWFGVETYGTPSLPTTYAMLEARNGTFFFFVLIVLIFYTGEVVHRDKVVHYDTIADALPVPDWMNYGAKLLSMIYICLLLCALILVSGVLNQTVKGYFNYEFSLYFRDLLGIAFTQYFQLVMLAFFVHTMVNQKFVGHIVTLAVYIVIWAVPQFADFNYKLAIPFSGGGVQISDMNGFGHYLASIASFRLYWYAFGGLLLVLALWFWNRGADTSFKARWQLARQRMGKASVALFAVLLLAFVSMGAWIYTNVSVKNRYYSIDEQRERQATFEKTYHKYTNVLQPKITSAKVNVDIYPDEFKALASGAFVMVNKGDQPIDSLFLTIPTDNFHRQLTKLMVDGKAPNLVLNDTELGYYIYRLPKRMNPGDSARLTMDVTGQYVGFANNGDSRDVVGNGTFFNVNIFPAFGYNEDDELSSDKYRKKYGLPIKEWTVPAQNDPRGLRDFLFTNDADWVTFEGTISTNPDQTAIMPGELLKTWTKNGANGKPRKYFHYKLPGFSDYFFSMCSANYAVKRDKWTGADGQTVALEVYHHPGHDKNIDRFIASMKASLTYYVKNYAPYPYPVLRVLEFPRYASFAQSFPTTVPYSEEFGWVGDFHNPSKTDYAFYVTAHEVAHQWWGHQIMPSRTRGANQISETMAEYSALMVLKQRYGADAMPKFLKYSLDSYLRGRSNEDKFEANMLDNDTRAYVWYQKGSMLMYALQDYIGEDRVNKAMNDYMKAARFRQKAPFTTSLEWYGFLKAATPDSLKPWLTDNFEKLTLYDNRITKAEAKSLGNGQYRVTLHVRTTTEYYDKAGKEISKGKGPVIADIAVLTDDGKNKDGLTTKVPLLLQKRSLSPGEHVIEVTVKGKPVKAGIDPYNKLIDRVSDDNLVKVDML
ncbi:ABC transporter permease/M1 family aminopeptidase [Spirosoma radiotolerans]|uniref:Peptidase M1 membrane alanine aminopeptidase n=1 Tax=Spirosoma radiotolerans TaxID=1379870 RepID=A0A0E3V5H3_9BACT|nr:M1 family aminopeptidase [Spirosoma radiotolerans]AKD53656.1 peptidase M1 membrane alanine aminopeptidase [Spirosoma radiotolerans]